MVHAVCNTAHQRLAPQPLLLWRRGSEAQHRDVSVAASRPRHKRLAEGDQAEEETCTLRGTADGCVVYKFGQLDPRDEDCLGEPTAQLPGVTWSSAVRLGSKFSSQLQLSRNKLTGFCYEYAATGSSAIALNYPLHRDFGRAVRRLSRLMEERRQQHGQGAEGNSSSGSSGSSSSSEEDCAGSGEKQMEAGTNRAGRRRRAQMQAAAGVGTDLHPASAGQAAPSASPRAPPVPAHEAVGVTSGQAAGAAPEPALAAADGRPGQAPGNSPTLRELAASAVSRVVGEAGLVVALARWWRDCAAALRAWAARAWVHRWPQVVGALLRPVPMWLRRRAQRQWPPAVNGHVSGALRRLLRGGVTRAALEGAAYDPCGISAAPLADLQAWQVEALTGARVRDVALYRSALTHPTALPAEVKGAHAYDRLEFLGDSVLEVVTRTVLMERYPEADEGSLTESNQLLVAGPRVAELATWLGLSGWLAMNAYSMRDGLQATPAVLEDTLEALLGALYLDAGAAAAEAFIRRALLGGVRWDELGGIVDFKGRLARLAAAERLPRPAYSVLAHDKAAYPNTELRLNYWELEVRFGVNGSTVVAKGSAFGRRLAEQAAARAALQELGHLPAA